MELQGKGIVGLCRESRFTALASEATFAVTDDQLNQRRWTNEGRWPRVDFYQDT